MATVTTMVCETSLPGDAIDKDSTRSVVGSPSRTGHSPVFQSRSENFVAPKPPILAVDNLDTSPDRKNVDSGYVSLRDTPTKAYEEPCHSNHSTTKKQIKLFDKDISEAHRQRFSDLQVLFGPDLRRYILKKLKGNQGFGTIAWRLKCLGETEESACPWILILCGRNVSEIVRKYLKRPQVKEQYQPQDGGVPSFNVHVCAFALKDLGSPFVYRENFGFSSQTLCGEVVCTVDGDKTSSATLGGVIKLEKQGMIRFFGMTAGHIADTRWFDFATYPTSVAKNAPDHLRYNDEEGYRIDDHSSIDEGDQKGLEALNLDESEDEFELDLEEVQDISKTVQLWEANRRLRQSAHQSLILIGSVQYHSSSAVTYTGRDLDWMLFDVGNVLPNLLEVDTQSAPIVLHQVSKFEHEDIEPGTPICILTSHGAVAGTIDSSAFILRPGAERPMKTFMIKLSAGDPEKDVSTTTNPTRLIDPLHIGDSGSWVINQVTNAVVGYVIASDIFQDVYVIPFQSALDDIKLVTGAEYCGLFDTSDPEYQVLYRSRASTGTDSGYVSVRNSPGRNQNPAYKLGISSGTCVPSPTPPSTYLPTSSQTFPPFVSSSSTVDLPYSQRILNSSQRHKLSWIQFGELNTQ